MELELLVISSGFSLLLWVLIGLIGYYINPRPLSFWLGIIFGIFGLIISAIMYVADKNDKPDVKSTKKFMNSVVAVSITIVSVVVLVICAIQLDKYFERRSETIKHERLVEQIRLEKERELTILRQKEKLERQRAIALREQQKLEEEKRKKRAEEARIVAIEKEKERKTKLELDKYRQDLDHRLSVLTEKEKLKNDLIKEEKEKLDELRKKLDEENKADELAEILAKKQDRIDWLSKKLESPTDWNSARLQAKELEKIATNFPDLNFPPRFAYDMFLQDKPLEVLNVDGLTITGYVSEENDDSLSIDIVWQGNKMGSRSIDKNEITTRRMATRTEWEESNKTTNKKSFDWDSWYEQRKIERAEEKKRSEQRAREREERKRQEEILKNKSRPVQQKRIIGTLGSSATVSH